MKTSWVCFFILLFAANLLHAQTPAVVWQKCFGGANGDYAQAMEPTTDGGFIVAGSIESGGGDILGYHGNNFVQDYWVIKLNSSGAEQWQRSLGGVGEEICNDIHQTPDGGYIVAGSSASRGCDVTGNHNGLDYWIVKLTPAGDIEWENSYGGNDNDYAYSVAIAPDGYFVAGFTLSHDGDVTKNNGGRDYWVIKIDLNGKLIWQKSVGGSLDEEARAVKATKDGGCIVAGFTESNDLDVTVNHGVRDCWIVKLSSTGDMQWQKSLGGSYNDEAASIQLTADGGYIMAGEANSNNGDVSGNHVALGVGAADFWVVKLTETGIVQWQQCYGGNHNEIGRFIQLTPDGGYLVSGQAGSEDGDLTCNAGITDMWIIKINNAGKLLWQKSLGGSSNEDAFSVQPLADGSCVVAGFTCSNDVTGYHPHRTVVGTCADFMVVKLSPPVVFAPSPTVTIQPASGSICAGTMAKFTGSAIYSGTDPVYKWVRNGVAVGSGHAYAAADFVNGETLICSVTSGGGCETTPLQSSNSVVISTNNNFVQPEVSIDASSTAICDCSPVLFTATVKNGGSGVPAFQWMLNGASNGVNGHFYLSNSLQNGDKVNCTYSDISGCVTGGSVLSNTIQISAGTAVTPSVSIDLPETTVCDGTKVTFKATAINGGLKPTYVWTVNGVKAGTNNSSFSTATLKDGDVVACNITIDPLLTCATKTTASSNNIKITISGKVQPAVSISAGPGIICTGHTATFTATAVNAGTNPSYQWLVNGSNAGTNSNTFNISTLANGDAVSCNITADPLFTCALVSNASSNSIDVNVVDQPDPSAVITSSLNDVCAGTTIKFNVQVQNAGVSPAYQWVVNTDPVNFTSTQFYTNTLSNGDIIYCSLTPGSGSCTLLPISSNKITAVINALPVVSITPADTIITVNKTVRFTANVSGDNYTYAWSPANMLTSTASLTPETVPLVDNTTYKLAVETSKGCKGSAEAFVRVARPLILPTAFTPNGDLLNDVFRIPPGVPLELKEFAVFNRWGAKVFTTRDVTKGWDGFYNGVKAGAGVYVYIITGTGIKGPVSVKGTVVLVR